VKTTRTHIGSHGIDLSSVLDQGNPEKGKNIASIIDACYLHVVASGTGDPVLISDFNKKHNRDMNRSRLDPNVFREGEYVTF
jgi:hypothetical protein